MKNKNNLKLAAIAMFAALNFNAVASSNRVSSANLEVSEDVAPSGYLNLTSMCSDDPAATRRWRVRNYTASPVNYTWDVYGTAQNGSGVALPGDNFFETVTVPGSPNTTRIFWTVEGSTYSKVKASGGAQCATPPVVIPCGTNLIVNGNFEGGNTGFTSGYTFKVDGAGNTELVPENTYGVGPNVATYHPQLVGTGRSGNYMMVNGNTQTIKTVWSQTVNVTAGKEYAFAMYAQNTFGASPAVLRVYAGENMIGSAFSPTGIATWSEFAGSFTAAATGALEIKIIDANLTKTGNDFGLDDISLIEVCPELPPSCYAEEVISFNQGPKQDLISTIEPARSNPASALGAPENNDTQNFVALGFGGEIVLKFGSPIKNGEGNDVRVIETTFGSPICERFPETVRAYASQDGCNWVWLGDACQDVDFDLGSLAWAQYVKLVDISSVSAVYQGVPNADAYDVDGVMCLNGYEENPVPATVTVGADEVVSYTQGLRKNGTPITASRTNAANALGAPQGTDVINFVSLGFGGSIVVKYNYVIFDNPAANDLMITETSFGNPSCASYPERAEIEGSLDGVNWTSLGEVCLDGQVDISAAGAIQYIRITDRSAASSFGGSADGYDVDGIVVINSLCAPTSTARFSDNVTTPNEVVGLEVFPNPFQDETIVAISAGELDNSANLVVTNFLGQVVKTEKVSIAASAVTNHYVNFSGLKSGIYFISVETNTGREVAKVVKQ
jgi:hypothetical protein